MARNRRFDDPFVDPGSASGVDRRDFFRLAAGGCAALTNASLLSTLLNLRLTGAAYAATGDLTGYKALVCVFLHGGNDSFNMLVPLEPAEYADYVAVRGNLALPSAQLLPIADVGGRQFGIHPGMTEVRDLYVAGKLGFLANVGSLIAPTDKAMYSAKQNLPLGLFSHSDQQRHWQTSVPQSRNQITGWAGRMADLLTDQVNSNPAISMNIALGHLNILQTGDDVVPYVVQSNGAQLLSGYGSGGALNQMLTQTTDSLLEQTYNDLLKQTHRRMRRQSIDAALLFNDAVNSVSLTTAFPATNLGRQLEMVARSIASRGTLGQTRQIFFVELGGWDHHDEVLNAQAVKLPEVSAALKAFYDATVEIGVENDVATFSASDFARTLSSNGNGSDHAWGANHIVMGGGVLGGRIHGQYPSSLALGNPLDVGRGRLIPTLSVDEYAAEMALWFGLANDAALEAALPNIRNFYPSGASGAPVGFLI